MGFVGRCSRFAAANIDELPAQARAISEQREVLRTACRRDLGVRQPRGAAHEINQRDVTDAQPALVVQADAHIHDAALDVLEVAGDAIAIAQKHRRAVFVAGEGPAGQHKGCQREREDELSNSHAV